MRLFILSALTFQIKGHLHGLQCNLDQVFSHFECSISEFSVSFRFIKFIFEQRLMFQLTMASTLSEQCTDLLTNPEFQVVLADSDPTVSGVNTDCLVQSFKKHILEVKFTLLRISYKGLGRKKRTFEFYQNLIRTPSGDFKQVSDKFQVGDLVVLRGFLV